MTGIVDGARCLKDQTYVKPECQRPDNNGRVGFFWDTSQLELVVKNPVPSGEPWPLKVSEEFIMTDRLQGEQFDTGDIAMVISPKIDQFGGVWIAVKNKGMRVHWSRLHTPVVDIMQNWAVVSSGDGNVEVSHDPSFADGKCINVLVNGKVIASLTPDDVDGFIAALGKAKARALKMSD